MRMTFDFELDYILIFNYFLLYTGSSRQTPYFPPFSPHTATLQSESTMWSNSLTGIVWGGKLIWGQVLTPIYRCPVRMCQVATQWLTKAQDLRSTQRDVKKRTVALGWLIWLGCHPIHQKLWVWFLVRAYTQVAGLIPWLGGIWEATDRCFCFSWRSSHLHKEFTLALIYPVSSDFHILYRSRFYDKEMSSPNLTTCPILVRRNV